jgi:hypothetical protein
VVQEGQKWLEVEEAFGEPVLPSIVSLQLGTGIAGSHRLALGECKADGTGWPVAPDRKADGMTRRISTGLTRSADRTRRGRIWADMTCSSRV